MMMTENYVTKRMAESNLEGLANNSYPGRGIVVGLDKTGEYLVLIYWIMGRSANSRNRVFVKGRDDSISTQPADPSQVKDPSLIIYTAVREVGYAGRTVHVVSNGKQTDEIADAYRTGRNLYDTLNRYEYEPDTPHFTSRITACSGWRLPKASPVTIMSILRKSPWSNVCDHHQYEFNGIGRGFGHCITTYAGDGDPLPAFHGEPYLLPLCGDASSVASTFWRVLNSENRVSLVVKFVPKHGGPSQIVINNEYSKTPLTV